ncbi:MAG: ECF transporter S component [Defluviitaleaceae bacterium]|nr:ECF transporter S component [Defluviitaleaceae bacterium]
MKYIFLLLLTVPLTVFAGIYLFGDRQFLFVSVLILIQSMVPFVLLFERRKPAARELVIIAVLCAIGVAGRGAFFMFPQFKPVVAIVIIGGVALGKERGFLIGALTVFVSNMFFGQGPWTPWQIFAMGFIGFLSGGIFYRRKRNTAILAVFGAAATLIVYGGIMNPAGVLMFQPQPTREMFLLSYIVGLPFDLIHAFATAVFLFIISRPMLEKLDRVKTKYGIL